jgi:hypothetical protein
MPAVVLPKAVAEFVRLAEADGVAVSYFSRSDGAYLQTFECRTVECRRGAACVVLRLLEDLNVWGQPGELSAEVVQSGWRAWFLRRHLRSWLRAVGITKVA